MELSNKLLLGLKSKSKAHKSQIHLSSTEPQILAARTGRGGESCRQVCGLKQWEPAAETSPVSGRGTQVGSVALGSWSGEGHAGAT